MVAVQPIIISGKRQNAAANRLVIGPEPEHNFAPVSPTAAALPAERDACRP
jgi:hypothetical protein